MADLSGTSSSLPSVAVVILNWNGRPFLEKFLPPIFETTYSNFNLYVADNNSTDDSISFLQQNYPAVRIIRNPGNEGYARGYNLALKHLTEKYFVLLNSDVEVTPGWLEPLVSLLESDPSIAAAQPKILDEKKKSHFEYAGACGGWIDRFGYPFARGRILESVEADTGQYDSTAPCFWAGGACLFVSAKAFREVKGLDEYFFAHQEEVDLCWRLQRAGYKVFAAPASTVYHVGGGTLPKGNSKKVYLNYRNNLIMICKNSRDAFWIVPCRFALDAIAAWRNLLSGNTGYFTAVARAHFHLLRWLFAHRSRSVFTPSKNKNITGRYGGAILLDYYLRGKRRFTEIVRSK